MHEIMNATGERFIPQSDNDIDMNLEHYQRYYNVLNYISKDMTVLDIASGEGHGSEILSRTAKQVYGVDIAAEAVEHAKSVYRKDNLDFRQGSASDIPFPDASMDAVVSFETIEHLPEEIQEKMIQEIKRVLVPNGFLVISSPGKATELHSEEIGVNPFHAHELSRTELESLIRKYFKNMVVGEQTSLHGTLIQWKNASVMEHYTYPEMQRTEIIQPSYFIAIASDEEITLPVSSEFQISKRPLEHYEQAELFYKNGEPEFLEKNKLTISIPQEHAADASFHFDLPDSVMNESDRFLRFDYGIMGRLYQFKEFEITDKNGEVILSFLDDFHLLRCEGAVCSAPENGEFLYFSNSLDPKIFLEIPASLLPRAKCLKCRIFREEMDLLSWAETKNKKMKKELESLRDALSAIEKSRIWRMTKPIRSTLDAVKATRIGQGLRSFFRGELKTIWEKMRGATYRNRSILDLTLQEYHLAAVRSKSHFPQYAVPETCKVVVVIPVYNGLVHLQKLTKTLFRHTPEKNCTFVFLNDASPNASITPFLQTLSTVDARVKVYTNPENLGFVKSVNKAISLCPEADYFVLLNTDTEVPDNWLSRLLVPMLRDASVATVTPFSNGATIFSLPNAHEDNHAFTALFPTECVDAIVQTYSLPNKNRNTLCGVGFCMAVNAAVWRKIGPLNEDVFEKGYGEDIEWCMRASFAGFKNQIAPNLYVAHFHGGSFASEEKKLLCARHQVLLEKLYPEFFRLLPVHMSRNRPVWDAIRVAVALQLILTEKNRPVLIFDHSTGGGANEYRNRRIKEILSEKRSVLLLTPGIGIIHATLFFDHFQLTFHMKHLSILTDPLFAAIHEILLNELVSWTNIFGRQVYSSVQYTNLVREILQIKTKLHATMSVMMHDFFLLCPHINLFHINGYYCNPDKSATACRKCIHKRHPDTYPVSSTLSALEWRKTSQRLVQAADELRFFSQNTIDVMKQVLDFSPDQVKLVPHAALVDFNPILSFRTTPITIGIVGSIGIVKGACFIVELANYLKEREPSTRIVIIGITSEKNLPDNVYVHGPYQQKQLPSLIVKYGVNVGFISSLWPETFSYVTQELMMLGLPLVCFNLGAPAERIGAWEKGRIIPSISPDSTWKTIRELHESTKEN